MKKYLYIILALAVSLTAKNGLAQSSNLASKQLAADNDAAIQKMLEHYDKQINFTENKGQWPVNVLYKADFPLGQAIATKEGMMVGTFDPASIAARNAQVMQEERDLQNGLPRRQ